MQRNVYVLRRERIHGSCRATAPRRFFLLTLAKIFLAESMQLYFPYLSRRVRNINCEIITMKTYRAEPEWQGMATL